MGQSIAIVPSETFRFAKLSKSQHNSLGTKSTSFDVDFNHYFPDQWLETAFLRFPILSELILVSKQHFSSGIFEDRISSLFTDVDRMTLASDTSAVILGVVRVASFLNRLQLFFLISGDNPLRRWHVCLSSSWGLTTRYR